MASHCPTTRAAHWSVAARAAALTLVTAASLAACGGPKAPTAATAPSAAPSVDDSSADVVAPPSASPAPAGTAAPSAAPSVVRSSAPKPTAAAPNSATVAGAADPASVAAGAAGATGHTVPGLADGAVALPSTVQVSDNSRCRLSALQLQPVDLQGSPGGTYADFRLVNVSKTACAVRGYVSVTLLGDSGNALPTAVRQEAGPEVWVNVAPSGAAQFHLRFPNPMSGDSPCMPPNAPRIRIGVPGTTGTLTGDSPDGGIQACHGEVSTAPLGST